MTKRSVEEDLVESFFKISRSLKSLSIGESKTAHLTMLQLETLVLLNKNGKSSMGNIAGFFQIKMPTATVLLDKLIRLKMAKRLLNPKDRRIVEIEITESGKKILNGLIKMRKERIQHFLSYLSKKDKADLLRIIKKITQQDKSYED